jgi:fatty-acyl-CoA synthase
VLIVEGEDAPSDDVIRTALNGRVPRWWLPDAILRVEGMPLAMTGKIDKVALRARFGAADAGTSQS